VAPTPLAPPRLVADEASLAALVAELGGAARVALDVEADGLHAFRPKVCTVQLGYPGADGAMRVAIIDALAVGLAPLAALLGEGGPVKVLHDLTFDAKMLADASVPLGRVRDTSVAARLLGRQSTGLGALLASELGIAVDKRFQQHDWAARPLREAELAYLAGDVAHLLALDDHFAALAREIDLEDEIADECAHRLASAGAPPRDARPAYVRVKGAAALDPLGRATLRRLVEARDAAAERLDVPAFKVVGNDVLLEIARRRPGGMDELRAIRGSMAGRAARAASALLEAVRLGAEDGDVPEADRALFDPPRPDRAALARRRAAEARVSGWRRAEAKRRGVDEQAVLPGHCAQALTDAILHHAGDEAALREAVRAIPALGARRVERYLDALVALGRGGG
jgi:ribonuclease D